MIVVMSEEHRRQKSEKLLEEMTNIHTKALNELNYIIQRCPEENDLTSPPAIRARLSDGAINEIRRYKLGKRFTSYNSNRSTRLPSIPVLVSERQLEVLQEDN